jgi:hypothetical protein
MNQFRFFSQKKKPRGRFASIAEQCAGLLNRGGFRPLIPGWGGDTVTGLTRQISRRLQNRPNLQLRPR